MREVEVKVWCEKHRIVANKKVAAPSEPFPFWDQSHNKVVSIDLCADCRVELIVFLDIAREYGEDWVPPKKPHTDAARAPGEKWDCLLCNVGSGYKAFSALSGHYQTTHGIKPAGMGIIYNGECPVDGEEWEQLGRHASSVHGTNIPGVFAEAVKAGDPLGIVKKNIARLMDLSAEGGG